MPENIVGGTDLSPQRIGAKPSQRARRLLGLEGKPGYPLSFAFSKSGEGAAPPAADTIRLTYQVEDIAGNDIAHMVDVIVRCIQEDGTIEAAADHTLTVVTGTAVTTDVKPGGIWRTDKTGLLVLDLEHVSAPGARTTYAEAKVRGQLSIVSMEDVVFA